MSDQEPPKFQLEFQNLRLKFNDKEDEESTFNVFQESESHDQS